MAITDPLASVDDYIGVRGDVQDKNVLLRQLRACSRLYEKETKQFYTKDAAAVARVWVAKYVDYLDLWGTRDGCPGLATSSGLIIKEDSANDGTYATTWSNSDVEMLPRGANLGTEPKPWDRLSIPPWSTRSFTPGRRYQVTGVYGYPEVPAGAIEDVIELCAIWRTDSPLSLGNAQDLDTTVNTSPLMMSLVRRLRDSHRGKVTF
ncbi:MAG: hypothetical protein AB7P33_09840 [Dehalococcoidia bacterium]